MATPVELSSGQGRYEMFWTPTRELLLFDNERGQVWIRRGDSWGLMPKIGGVEETVALRPKSVSIVLNRAVRALRAAEEQLKKAYGPDHASVLAIREEIDGLSAGPAEEQSGSIASAPK